MSRTYHHGYRAKQRLFKEREEEWHYYRNEPKYWRKMAKHRPQRQKCRELQSKVIRGYEEQLWPLDRKPWIYYW